MNKKHIILVVATTLMILLIGGCVEELDPCDLNKDGKVDAIEKQICEQQQIETCGPDNNGYCIDFREKCKTGYEGIGPDKCRRGRSAECCVPVEATEEFNYNDESSMLGISGGKDAFNPKLMLTLTEDEKFERTYNKFDLIKEVSAHWYRIYSDLYASFNFHRAKKSQGKYDFSKQDKMIKGLQERDINIVVMIGPWRSNFANPDSQGNYLNFDLDEYKEYVEQAVERYDNDGLNDMPGLKYSINHWEVDSEPDVHYHYGQGKFESPEEYFTVLKATYESIKKANPNAKVIIGAFTYLGQNK